MPWQQIVTGLIVASASAYVIWRLRGKKRNQRRSQGPDVPVSRLTKKRPPSDSCGH